MSNQQSLHVPNSTQSNVASMNSIMAAYQSQSKIPLYDESSSLSNDNIEGVKAKDIPIAALRPNQQNVSYVDKNGNKTQRPVYSKSRYVEDMEMRADIRKAYNRMNGIDESNEEDENQDLQNPDIDRFSNIEDAEIEYIEDVPNDNEGLLHYLETCIKNAEANLEMLKSLYAALQ